MSLLRSVSHSSATSPSRARDPRLCGPTSRSGCSCRNSVWFASLVRATGTGWSTSGRPGLHAQRARYGSGAARPSVAYRREHLRKTESGAHSCGGWPVAVGARWYVRAAMGSGMDPPFVQFISSSRRTSGRYNKACSFRLWPTSRFFCAVRHRNRRRYV